MCGKHWTVLTQSAILKCKNSCSIFDKNGVSPFNSVSVPFYGVYSLSKVSLGPLQYMFAYNTLSVHNSTHKSVYISCLFSVRNVLLETECVLSGCFGKLITMYCVIILDLYHVVKS